MFDFFKKDKKVISKVEKYDKTGKEKVELESALLEIENGNINSGMDSLIRLALADYPDAEYYLGDINEFKIHNYKEAAKWYLFAAEHGQPNAQRSIADMYTVGRGVEVNVKEAIKWYVKAAEQGIPEAQFVLGEHYRSGVSVNKDTDIARKYYTLSANNGYEPAKIRLEQLKSKNANHKSKDNLEQTPAQFNTELLEGFVELATKEGYLQGTPQIVPEIMQWGAYSFLRAIKNTDKISLTDINLHYMYVGMLNFIYASDITQTWNENYSLFKKTDYKVNGLEEDFEQALKKMLLTFSKINGENSTTQEFTNFFIKLSEIFNKKMIPYFNVSDRIQKDFIFAGMSSYFTLGMAIKLKSIDKGTLENSKCDDISTYCFDNGDKYVGQFKNNLRDGSGTFYYNNGDKYVGQFRNDKREGTGIYYYVDGRKKEGSWLDDKMEGMGTSYSTNGSSRYVGQFKNDLMEGNGTYCFFSGDRDGRDKYVGQFRDGGMEGEGTLYFASGDKYVGQWKNNLKEDYGTYYYNNGDKYVGQYKNDLKDGIGTLFFPNGTINFEGEWLNGERVDNRNNEDQFKNGKKEGTGTVYNSDGSLIYESNAINIQVEKYAKLAEELLKNNDCDIGDLDEICSLLEIFDKGNENIKKDEEVAFSLACFAALRGSGNAQNHVGYCFDNGVIVEEDKAEAFYWFEKASLNKNEFAYFNLGEAYFHGYGVDINLESAEKWYRFAAENNVEPAFEMLEKIKLNKGNINKSIDSGIDFAELLIKEAQQQGWLAENKELKFILELISMQNNATEYLLKFMFEQIEEDEEMATTFTFMMTRYLFAKSVEAAIVWGNSKDGKISIYYHTKHLIDKQLEFEIPKIYQKYAFDSLKVGESLFSIYNNYMVNEMKTGKKVDLYNCTKELFNWIQKLGIHYALENRYESLWKDENRTMNRDIKVQLESVQIETENDNSKTEMEVIKMKEKYNYIKQDDSFIFYEGQNKLQTPMGADVITKYESIAERLVKDLNKFGEDASDPISLVAFHYAMIDFYSNMELGRDFIEHSIAIGLDLDKDWTFNCPSEEPALLIAWDDTFGIFENQSPKGKEWLNTLSSMQLCSVCVIGRALESVNIPYIIANIKDMKELERYSKFIDEFYPYIGIENLNAYFDNLLFYFNVESGNENKCDDMNTYYYDNGDKYVGQFKNDLYNGMGTFYYADGSRYVGQFRNDKKEGDGTLYNSDGSVIYDGEWLDDDMNGLGTYFWDDGDKYVGQFINDLYNGIGTFYYDDGKKYVGQFKNDNKEGTGTSYNSNGSIIYDGEWIEDDMDGMGTYFFADGDKYVGQLKNSNREGSGTLYNSNGSIIYEGEWVEDDMDGMGTYFFDDGNKYVGQFKEDKKEGTGTLYNSDGLIIYDGEWSDDDMDGMGTLSPHDGDEYVGQASIFDIWSNNEEHIDIDLLANSIMPASIASEMGCNSDEIPNSSGKFGYDIYNPIPVAGIESNKVYLSRLITDKNEKITWDRVGSYDLKGTQGCIDEYNIYLESTKQNLCSLFINPYNKKTSNKAPEGFKIV